MKSFLAASQSGSGNFYGTSMGGTRNLQFGVTLANQVQVIRQLGAYSGASRVEIEAGILPRALQAILALQPPQRNGSEPTKTLVVRYLSSDPNDAHVELTERADSQ